MDTLGHIAREVPGLKIPNLKKAGNGQPAPLRGYGAGRTPLGRYMRLKERSRGKDTMTGHWEMMGLLCDHALPDIYQPRFSEGTDRRAGEAGPDVKSSATRAPAERKSWMNWRRRRFGKVI